MTVHTMKVVLTLSLDDADDRSIRSVAQDDFGVEGAADMTLADVVCGIIRNTLDAQFYGFSVPVSVVDCNAEPMGEDVR